MKILALAGDLGAPDGWGSYSRGLILSLDEREVETIAAVNHSGDVPGLKQIQLLPDPLNYLAAFLVAPWYAWRLRRYARQCDLIHALLESYAFIAYWLALFSGRPYIVTAHGTYSVLPYRLGGYVRAIHHYAFRRARAIVCMSEYTKNALAAYGVQHLEVIHAALRPEKFPTVAPNPLSGRETSMLSVGALKYRKGLHISLAAFAEARKVIPNLRYYIVGDERDTSYVNRLKQQALDLALGDSVQFLGAIPEEELIHLYNRVKLFILTSVSEGMHFEGFGLVYIEANAYGVPAIGSRESGAEDAVENGSTGLLVPQGNVARAADAIVKILHAGILGEGVSQRAIQWAEAHAWRSTVMRYLKVYRATIQNFSHRS